MSSPLGMGAAIVNTAVMRRVVREAMRTIMKEEREIEVKRRSE
jgi:hypothetical protein